MKLLDNDFCYDYVGLWWVCLGFNRVVRIIIFGIEKVMVVVDFYYILFKINFVIWVFVIEYYFFLSGILCFRIWKFVCVCLWFL